MPLNRSSVRFCLLLLLAGICGSVAAWTGLSLYLSPNLPAVDSLREYKFETPLRIYSSDGKLIQEYGEKRSIPISFEETPPLLIKAFLAAEDDRFYSHNGVSIRGLLRAASQMLLQSDTQTGGSTITQQVAKNFFLSFEKTVIRKLKELLLALKIEKELEKDEILELYINKIPFGNRAYGARAAARVYYGKELSELKLSQLAMIAHMPQRPSDSNPISNPQRAMNRRDWILARMHRLGYIDEASYRAAAADPNTARYHGLNLDLNAPYISEMARLEMIDQYGPDAYTAGYRVYTTVGSEMQAAAQRAVINGALAYDNRHGYRPPDLKLKPQIYDANSAPNEEPSRIYTRSTEEGMERLDLDPWLRELRSIPNYGGLNAAVVLELEEEGLKALIRDGSIISLPWSGAPRGASNILEVGSVIRARPLPGERWQLAQIPEVQAAMVALDPNNGAVLSLVGGFDFSLSNFNRVTQAQRQPGSIFKPFVYTAAMLNNYHAASIVNDAPIVKYDNTLDHVWRPENYGGRYNGPTRLRKGLYQSTNYIAIRILDAMGVPTAVRELDRFGFDTAAFPRDLTVALGSHALTPMEITRAYAVFANGGYLIDPHFIERIEDAEGNVLFEAKPPTVCRECENLKILESLGANALAVDTPGVDGLSTETLASNMLSSAAEELSVDESLQTLQLIASENEADEGALALTDKLLSARPPAAPRVLDERTAYIMDNILRDVVKEGTGRRARSLGRGDLAGKTGTTNDSIDAWFAGYNQSIVATTWMGFDNNSPLGRNEQGSNATLPIWIEFMQTALRGVPEIHPEQPPGIVTVRINSNTGLRTDANDPDAMFEVFRAEEVPPGADELNFVAPEDSEANPDDLF